MKINFTTVLLLLCVLGVCNFGYAQKEALDRAHANYENFQFVESQKTYLNLVEQGYASEEIFTKLGNTYYFNAQYQDATTWYNRLFELNAEVKPLILLRYSQALKATGDSIKAKKMYNAYIAKTNTSTFSKKAVDYLELVKKNSGRYQLQPLEAVYDINNISYGHTKLGNKLIYASTKTINSFSNTKSAWDGLGFLSLFEIPLNAENIAVGKPKKMRGRLNSKFHDSSPVYTKDGNTVYFTRNNNTSKNKENTQNLKIYRAQRKGKTWQKPEELNFNSDFYSCAHPALSPDEKRLYFASNRPGGFGESDIYLVRIAEDGSLSAPLNLGPEVNTEGKETFPFVSKNNALYFSSDGHFGLGGLDVFYVEIDEENESFGQLFNVGAPVNSYADDFAFGIDSATKRGFVSSNRSKREGVFVYDNIYSFLETTPIIDVYKAEINGFVTNLQASEPIKGATITFTDTEGEKHTVKTNEDGFFSSDINRFKEYTIRASHDLYDIDEKTSESRLDVQRINFQLQKNKEKIISGADLAKVLNIPNIYFDFDKSKIRPDAKVELSKIIAAFNLYPQLKLNIRSHTDSRGNDSYNKALSEDGPYLFLTI